MSPVQWILEMILEIFADWIGKLLFLTGEALRVAFSMGRHRVHWWEEGDPNVAWPSVALGLLFWAALIGLLVLLL